jgi:hypothetical protein
MAIQGGDAVAVRFRLFSLGLLAAACGFAAPAHAQSDPLRELDGLADASSDPRSGVDLARDQIRQGNMTGAVATLERVLMDYPETDTALTLHASLLCRLDDRAGARLELGEFNFPVSDQDWREVTDACGPMPRPGRGGRR